MAARFDDRTIIVTGAGGGMGRAVCLQLCAEGATVVGCDVHAAGLDQLTTEANGGLLRTVVADITQESDVQAVVAAAAGRIDGLANVAGIMDNFLPPSEIDDAVWQRVFDVNVTAMMRLTRAVLPFMIQAGGGAIVNVSSEAGIRGSAAGAAYTASKHAVNGFTKSISVFHRPQGIRANAVLPGPVATSMVALRSSDYAESVLAPYRTIIPPRAQADEVAALVLWLLSDAASNVSGALVPCDGGWSAI